MMIGFRYMTEMAGTDVRENVGRRCKSSIDPEPADRHLWTASSFSYPAASFRDYQLIQVVWYLIKNGGNTMKKLTILIIIAFVTINMADAQSSKPVAKSGGTTSADAQEVKPAVKAGAMSLNFNFGGLGTFGIGPAGVNGGVSFSYFLSNDAAVRVGLQGVLNSSTKPWNDISGNGTNPGTDGTSSTFGLGLGADYLMFVSALTPRVKPYVGIGAFVQMNSSTTKPAISNSAGDGTVTETKNGNGNEGVAFGLGGIAGAEFFLYPEISLSAEYQLTLISLLSRSDEVVSYKGNPSRTTKQGSATQILGFSTFGATLHIYF